MSFCLAIAENCLLPVRYRVSRFREWYRIWMLDTTLFPCCTCIRLGTYLNLLVRTGSWRVKWNMIFVFEVFIMVVYGRIFFEFLYSLLVYISYKLRTFRILGPWSFRIFVHSRKTGRRSAPACRISPFESWEISFGLLADVPWFLCPPCVSKIG